MNLSKRQFLSGFVAGGLGLTGFAHAQSRMNQARVLVIGGGFGGATAAKYIKAWAPECSVTLVERESQFVSCPLSNLILSGYVGLNAVVQNYQALKVRGIEVIMDEAIQIDAATRSVRLARAGLLTYDRVIVSPGVDYLYDSIPGLNDESAQAQVLHAWKAGPQTLALQKQLQAMDDGGVFVFHIPLAPFRCPAGPYERVCQIADYFKRHKPRSKIIVLDSNPEIVSKPGLFHAAWDQFYPSMIDYQPNSEMNDVDAKNKIIKLQFDDIKGDVISVLPPQRAAQIALRSGLITANGRWCGVDWTSCESIAAEGSHILGHATLAGSLMPKSASMANQQAKVCAAAVIALLQGEAVNPQPVMMNTCYSFVDGQQAMHVASLHQYNAQEKSMVAVKGAGGLSTEPSVREGQQAWAWAKNIWADTFH